MFQSVVIDTTIGHIFVRKMNVAFSFARFHMCTVCNISVGVVTHVAKHVAGVGTWVVGVAAKVSLGHDEGQRAEGGRPGSSKNSPRSLGGTPGPL